MAAITQPVTVNIFGKSQRNAGTYTTLNATIPEGVYSVGMKDTMTDADASDPANSFILSTFISQDGVTWRAYGFREQWQGGTFKDKFTGLTVPRHINVAFSDTALSSGAYLGWFVRAELILAVRMSVGFDLTAYPAGAVLS